MNISLTPEQIAVIKSSLQGSASRASQKGLEAARNGFHDAEQAQAFYAKLEADCLSILEVIEAATAEPAEDNEDTCSQCGEDHGFCQCKEEDADA